MNGKGDKSRVTDVKRYRNNFDAIQWKKKIKYGAWIKLPDKLGWLPRGKCAPDLW